MFTSCKNILHPFTGASERCSMVPATGSTQKYPVLHRSGTWILIFLDHFGRSEKFIHSTLPLSGKVSTPTGIISHFVNLQVVVPEAFILGSGELHVDMGSTINLVCIIEKLFD
ncbi:Dgri\GH17246-PA-like protein [Anopheles sinensis]|uniref:Dgri\GH17246-PA-like protein n=1 Tax=Anopheles sinensis TaxID=74873 RepID=A0A084WKE8_ANOSI|nr:Dgri\GH17246-PA-like protein [Anopheles sinensis]